MLVERVVAAVSASTERARYSTRELLELEQRVVDNAIGGQHAAAGVADEAAVDAALGSRPTMGDDQAELVRRVCLDSVGIQVVVGPPGTGKTFALAAAREAWEASGFQVYGAAVARRAAVALSAAAGIEATSIAALLTDLRRPGASFLDERAVLVVDEAGMVGTRDLAELSARTVSARAKLVLVGDHEQLPEIDAGGVFRTLVSRTDPIRLAVNRRQSRESERRLLDLWRAGELEAALTIATEGGDLVMDVAPEQAFVRIVGDYCDSIRAGDDAVMLAPRRAEVRHLNELARATMVARGELSPDWIAVHGQDFAVGDRVVLRRNDRRLRVENGTRAQVTGIDQEAMAMTIQLSDGSRRELPSRYLLARSPGGVPAVEHGYAMTAHLAQGMTADRTFILGSETVYREWGYVAWSRARHGTRFYVVEPDASDEHHTAAGSTVDRFETVGRRLGRSEAQHAGVESLAGKHVSIPYVERALGPRPDTFRRRRRWDKAARRLQIHREQLGVIDGSEPLGPRPMMRSEAVAWERANRDLTKARLGLGLGREASADRGHELPN